MRRVTERQDVKLREIIRKRRIRKRWWLIDPYRDWPFHLAEKMNKPLTRTKFLRVIDVQLLSGTLKPSEFIALASLRADVGGFKNPKPKPPKPGRTKDFETVDEEIQRIEREAKHGQ